MAKWQYEVNGNALTLVALAEPTGVVEGQPIVRMARVTLLQSKLQHGLHNKREYTQVII